MGSCRAWSVYLTTRLLGRLSPLSGDSGINCKSGLLDGVPLLEKLHYFSVHLFVCASGIHPSYDLFLNHRVFKCPSKTRDVAPF